jgi:L-asparaginase
MMSSRIVVLTTGGTIASRQDASGRHRSGALPGEELLAQVALPADQLPEIEVESLLQKPSNAIGLDDLLTLRKRCLALIEDDSVAGIVITHGTDTLEETAYFLDITLPGALPVILTGSQRAPHEPGTDAYRNLADAIRVAASVQAAALGTLVVFNQAIFAARRVRKVNSFQVQGFAAPETGPLGYVDGDSVTLQARPVRPTASPVSITTSPLPRVDILPAYLDAPADLIGLSVERGAAGLVIEGLGRGHVPPSWVGAIADTTARGIPVAVVSGCATGPVNASYEFIGSLAGLTAAGAIPLRDLSARKARLAMTALLASPQRDDLAAALNALTV